MEAETSLSKQMEENSKINAGLLQIQKDFDEQKRHWEQDNRHERKAVMERQKSLENDRQHWHEEKSCLLQNLSAMKETPEKKEEERKLSTEGLMERIRNLKVQMENIPNKKAEKKICREKFFLNDLKEPHPRLTSVLF